MVWDQGVAGSNPVFPIKKEGENLLFFYPYLKKGVLLYFTR
ncbi:hypothetical protein RV02_GL001953 [Enterococcus gilvus]|nr:hypothetical protein RV02_GL001953 [Enterococcus gilvus]